MKTRSHPLKTFFAKETNPNMNGLNAAPACPIATRVSRELELDPNRVRNSSSKPTKYVTKIKYKKFGEKKELSILRETENGVMLGKGVTKQTI